MILLSGRMQINNLLDAYRTISCHNIIVMLGVHWDNVCVLTVFHLRTCAESRPALAMHEHIESINK